MLERIRNENLNVYRASPQRLLEDYGQECQIAQDYHGRLIYELLQNADDAMANGSSASSIRFELTDTDLWVANSGRPLDEPDVRGLCGISASKKALRRLSRRASIGHKGMGFKSVLEISGEPEIHSGPFHFYFSPERSEELLKEYSPHGRCPTLTFRIPFEKERDSTVRALLAEYSTVIKLPLREGKKDDLFQKLKMFDPRVLLLCQHLERMEIVLDQ